MSQPLPPVDDELIAAIVARAEGSAAHKLGLTTGERLQAFGWPAIDSVIRYLEREWYRNASTRTITPYLADIGTILALTSPEEYDYTLPCDQRPRNLCGRLWMFGYGNRKPYALHFIDEISSVDTHLSVKYDGRHEVVSFHTARIMSEARLNALREADSRFQLGYVNAALGDEPEHLTAMYHMLEAGEL